MATLDAVIGQKRAPWLELSVRSWQFLRRWPVIPMGVLIVLVVSAVFAPLLAPQDPLEQDLRARNAPPFWDSAWYAERPKVLNRHFLGADHVGRDSLSRIIHGARISMMVAGVSLISGLVVGTSLGLIAGWYGGIVDEVIGRIVDIWYALPFLLLALVISIVFGQSVIIMMGILALVAWSGFVRLIRAEVLSLKERDYIDLARVAGGSTSHILIKHILPGVSSTVIVIATLNVGVQR